MAKLKQKTTSADLLKNRKNELIAVHNKRKASNGRKIEQGKTGRAGGRKAERVSKTAQRRTPAKPNISSLQQITGRVRVGGGNNKKA